MRYRTIHNTDLRVSNVCLGNCSEQIPAIPFSSTAMGFFEKLKQAGVKSEKGRLVCEGNREAVGASLWDAYYNEDNLKKYELLLKLREETGHSLQALSLAYLISQPFQVFPIGAVRNTQQLKGFLEAGDMEMGLGEFGKVV